MKDSSKPQSPKPQPKPKSLRLAYASTLSEEMLLHLSRDQLRAIASAHGIPRGRNRTETIQNIVRIGVPVQVSLVVPAAQ